MKIFVSPESWVVGSIFEKMYCASPSKFLFYAPFFSVIYKYFQLRSSCITRRNCRNKCLLGEFTKLFCYNFCSFLYDWFHFFNSYILSRLKKYKNFSTTKNLDLLKYKKKKYSNNYSLTQFLKNQHNSSRNYIISIELRI